MRALGRLLAIAGVLFGGFLVIALVVGVLFKTSTTSGGGGVTPAAQTQTCAQAQVWMEGAAAPINLELSLSIVSGKLTAVAGEPFTGTATLRIPAVGFQGRQQPADVVQGRNFGSGRLQTSQVRLVTWVSFPEGDPAVLGEIVGCVGGPRLAGVPNAS